MSEPKQSVELYSKAFETFVQDAGDIVGLLAYAAYKASIRERRREGHAVPPHLRNPTRSEIEAYRGQADRALELYARRVIEEAAPGIVNKAQETAKREIIEELRKRTGLWQTTISGVIVWFVTIIFTLAVVFGAPEWVRHLVDRATSPPALTSPAAQSPKS